MQAAKVGRFLESGLNALMPHAERIRELRDALERHIPANLRRSCCIANYVQGKVVIFADNGAVAAKLRLLAPTLQTALLQGAGQITSIEVRVQPLSPIIYTQIARQLSPKAAERLREISAQLPDSELKNVMRRMAERDKSKR